MRHLSSGQIDDLVRRAIAARDQAYAPYSHFYVGAAILSRSDDGEASSDSAAKFVGCNVENASYGLTLCAERVAATAAVAGGCRSWQAMALASVGGVTPCGACRQFLYEFSPQLTIFLVDVIDGKRRRVQLSDLLPDQFDTNALH